MGRARTRQENYMKNITDNKSISRSSRRRMNKARRRQAPNPAIPAAVLSTQELRSIVIGMVG